MYREKFKHDIAPDELEKLVGAGEDFLLSVASMELLLLGDVQNNIFWSAPAANGKSAFMPRLKNIYLREENGRYVVDVEKATLRKIVADIAETRNNPETRRKGESLRTLCPAAAVDGKEGKNGIKELFSWYVNLAREFYFPRFLER